jgi:hypothetical protein
MATSGWKEQNKYRPPRLSVKVVSGAATRADEFSTRGNAIFLAVAVDKAV